MIGIYKIQSPTGKVYIGQSCNIEKRWWQHRNERRNSQKYPIIYSLLKYGNDAHEFKVLHELPADVTQDVVNIFEQIYMQMYIDAGVVLLNIKEGGKSGRHSEVTKNKIRKSSKEVKKTEEHLSKIIKKNKERAGYKLSDATKKKISLAAIARGRGTVGFTGRKHTEESRKKISDAGYKRRDSEEIKLTKSAAAYKRWEKQKGGGYGIS